MIRFMLVSSIVLSMAARLSAEGYWSGEGQVIPRVAIGLRTPTPQRIVKMNYQIGQSFKKGDILFQFDDRNARLEQQLAKTTLSKREMELKLAETRINISKAHLKRVKTEKSRIESLVDKAATPKSELDRIVVELEGAQTEVEGYAIHYEIARVEVETAKLLLDIENLHLEALVVRAPFDGIVVGQFCNVGDLVSKPDQDIYQIFGLERIVEVAMPARLVSSTKIGTEVEISFDKDFGDKVIKGKLDLISPIVHSQTKSVKIQIKLDDSANIHPGMLATVKIPTSSDKK